jgi:hypothetical protein
MYLEFTQLPPHSRIWIYQSDRKLSVEEVNEVSALMQSFCEQWEAHGQPLHTSFKIELNQFLIVAVDEGFNNASGCSIDGSVRILKRLQADRGINFLDASKIAFLINGEVHLHARLELKELFSSRKLGASSITFHNLVSSKLDLGSQWKIPVEKSWLTKYLPASTLIQ